MPLKIAIASAIATPSIRSPVGDTSVTVPSGGASITSTGRISITPSARGAAQRCNVAAGTPTSRANSDHQ